MPDDLDPRLVANLLFALRALAVEATTLAVRLDFWACRSPDDELRSDYLPVVYELAARLRALSLSPDYAVACLVHAREHRDN